LAAELGVEGSDPHSGARDRTERHDWLRHATALCQDKRVVLKSGVVRAAGPGGAPAAKGSQDVTVR